VGKPAIYSHFHWIANVYGTGETTPRQIWQKSMLIWDKLRSPADALWDVRQALREQRHFLRL
jgi:hypothetical protein